MATFKHNKKRSTGIVYEMLVRRLTKTMIEHDHPEYQRTLEIVRKYFGDGTPLAAERELFEVVRNTRGLSESAARRVLTRVQEHASKLDRHLIDIKKSNLIKEINYSFGRDFFNEHRVPDYRLLATIQMVIDTARESSRLTESIQRIQLEESLVSHMTGTEQASVQQLDRSGVDRLVMTMVAKRFGDKYRESLGPSQKTLLERYIRYQITGDLRPLSEFIVTEGRRGQQLLDHASSDVAVKSDSIMLGRLQESREKLTEIISKCNVMVEKNVDETVESMMLYQKLFEEIESDE